MLKVAHKRAFVGDDREALLKVGLQRAAIGTRTRGHHNYPPAAAVASALISSLQSYLVENKSTIKYCTIQINNRVS